MRTVLTYKKIKIKNKEYDGRQEGGSDSGPRFSSVHLSRIVVTLACYVPFILKFDLVKNLLILMTSRNDRKRKKDFHNSIKNAREREKLQDGESMHNM